jgi:hypothetical protein
MRTITHCSSCNITYGGQLNDCPSCGKKSNIKNIEIGKNWLPLTLENKDFLEEHCRTVFPEDVVAVMPSAMATMVGAKEEEELMEERRKKYDKIRQSKSKSITKIKKGKNKT